MIKVIDYEDGYIAYQVVDNVVVKVEVCETMKDVKKFEKSLDKGL